MFLFPKYPILYVRKLRKICIGLIVTSIVLSLIWWIIVEPGSSLIESIIWGFIFLFMSTFAVFNIVDRSHAQFHIVLMYGFLALLGNVWVIYYDTQFYSVLAGFLNSLICLALLYFANKGIKARI